MGLLHDQVDTYPCSSPVVAELKRLERITERWRW